MVDQRIEKLAKLCVHYGANVKPKENVIIEGPATAFPLMNEIYRECLLSAYPMILSNLETPHTFLKYAIDLNSTVKTSICRSEMQSATVMRSVLD